MKGTLRFDRGAWRLQTYLGRDSTGRRRYATRTVRAPDNRTGRRAAEKALAEMVARARRPLRGEALTVAGLLDRWVALHQPDWSPATLRDNRGTSRRHILPTLGGRDIGDVGPADLDRLYGAVRAAAGATTARRVHVILHAALAQAVRWGLLDLNPADAATPPRQPRTRTAAPPAHVLQEALRALEPTVALFVRLAATTGARRGQLCALRWDDLSLEDGTVTFARALVDGGPGVGVVERVMKVDRPYPVALDPTTVAELRAHRTRMAERALSVGVALGPYLFSEDPACRVPWRPDRASHEWNLARRRVPALAGVRLHDLRHFMATEMLAGGVDVRTVAGRLGHANPTVTLKVYGHFVPPIDRAAAEMIERRLDGG